MDVLDLFSSCKKGDVSRVRYLVEHRDVDLNVRDKWDSTPLYYACVCGYEDLVQYLLTSGRRNRTLGESGKLFNSTSVSCCWWKKQIIVSGGARCEANTFDGERCLYACLKDSIRRLLKDYKCVGGHLMQHDYFNHFLRTLLEQGQHGDVEFQVHGQTFQAHRCILSARSEYFAHMFETKWKGKNSISLQHPLINPAAFGAIMQFIYTGRMDIDIGLLEDCRRLAKQCKMADFMEELETKCKQLYDFELILQPWLFMTLWLILRQVGFGELPFNRADSFPTYPDICFRVDDFNFLCHKAFFCGRSDYFKALLEDHFSEGGQLQSQPGTPVITLHNISHEVFVHVMYYIYTNFTELTTENTLDVLCVADMYLLPGLKRLCGKTLAATIRDHNVLFLWKTARLFRLSRLEDQCIEFMAKIIDLLVKQPEFVEIIVEDAASLEDRHETDSVPLVDEIRYHIAGNVQTYSEIEEANQKLEILEDLLTSINIDC
ncbi:ankyrin repeat and BTB/POZ domain-containing protein 1 isoform X3 [Cynoglossus semilaevis]|uniref:ankyrin repeat and BTB/POZ domain-containing protein 1 isoform X3 n=1 Tax=Cynoglossus semilaevis TaxID=244447 RepID=UPI000D624DEE|nr:ankyrin repeat and BTB/POZ domain-containing protein 1 isoform X3 [Cynoglossus semilaevis]